jgi:hypothetical protein
MLSIKDSKLKLLALVGLGRRRKPPRGLKLSAFERGKRAIDEQLANGVSYRMSREDAIAYPELKRYAASRYQHIHPDIRFNDYVFSNGGDNERP